MDQRATIAWIVWLAGCIVVGLSQLGVVSARVGWTAFWTATVVAAIARLRSFVKNRRIATPTVDELRTEIRRLTNEIERGEGCRSEALLRRGTRRHALGEWEESIADLSHAIELGSEYEADARHWRASAFYCLGRVEEAKNDLTLAIHQFRTDAANREKLVDALRIRAFAFLLLGEWGAAIHDLNELIAHGETSAVHFHARGQAKFHTRGFADALADYQQAVAVDSKHAGAWHGISLVRSCCPDHRLRDGTEAVQCSQRACRLSNWSDWSIISGLAAAYAEVEDFESAVRYAELALELAPENEKSERRERVEHYRQGQPFRFSGASLVRPGVMPSPNF